MRPRDTAIADSPDTPETFFVNDFETGLCEVGVRAFVYEVEQNDGGYFVGWRENREEVPA